MNLVNELQKLFSDEMENTETGTEIEEAQKLDLNKMFKDQKIRKKALKMLRTIRSPQYRGKIDFAGIAALFQMPNMRALEMLDTLEKGGAVTKNNRGNFDIGQKAMDLLTYLENLEDNMVASYVTESALDEADGRENVHLTPISLKLVGKRALKEIGDKERCRMVTEMACKMMNANTSDAMTEMHCMNEMQNKLYELMSAKMARHENVNEDVELTEAKLVVLSDGKGNTLPKKEHSKFPRCNDC